MAIIREETKYSSLDPLTLETDTMLIEQVVSECERVLKANHDLVARLVSERKRFENWLHLEIFKALIPANPTIEIEKPFPAGKERCDLWVAEPDGKESWVELKLCVTNYCSDYTESLSARPITNQISDVVRDIEKLGRISEIHSRNVLLVAYPLPLNFCAHPQWTGHLDRMKTAAKKLEELFAVTVERRSKSSTVVGYVLNV